MSRRKKRRVSPAPLICLLAVLACIAALRISANEETAASVQMTGKLENPAIAAPVQLLEAEQEDTAQVNFAEERLARAARYIRGTAGRCRSCFQSRTAFRFPGHGT